MKKSFGILLALAMGLFASCDKKEISYNFAQFIYPNSYAYVYADQTTDTLKFTTTYDWSLTLSADWMSINADSMQGTVPQGYYVVSKLNVYFDVNNTDSVRGGFVYLHADANTLSAAFVQLGYLNVQRPTGRNGQFEQVDTARQVRDSVVFRTYSNDWTLAFSGDPSWVRLSDDATVSGDAGTYTVAYLLDENTSADERSAVLQLQSRGVTTDISIRQLGAEVDGQE